MTGIGPAVFSLHYHVAQLRGQVADPVDHFYRSWRENVRRVAALESVRPPRERLLDRILPLDAAAARLAGAAVAPQRIPVDANARELLERRLRLEQRIGQAKLLEGYLVSSQASRGGQDADWARIERKYLDLLGGAGVSPGEIQTALEKARPGTVPAATAAVESLFGISYGYDVSIDGCGKTVIAATGSAPTHSLPISEYSKLTDPTEWYLNIPNTFRVSYRTEDLDVPDVRDVPARYSLPHVPGHSFTGNLYEVAEPELFPGESVTQYRNILNIRFSGDLASVPTGRISVEYSLFESLTSAVLGFEAQGGVDADSGSGSVVLDAGSVVIACTKGVRFSAAAPFAAVLNLTAAPWLAWFMSYVIIGGLTLS